MAGKASSKRKVRPDRRGNRALARLFAYPDKGALQKFYVAALLGDEEARELVRRGAGAGKRIAIPEKLRGNIDYLGSWMIMRERIRHIADESHGFAPSPVMPGQFDLHLAIMSHGVNLSDALTRFVGASNLLRPDFLITCRQRRATLEISVRLKGKSDPVREIYHEVYATVLHLALRWVTGEAVDIVSARAALPTAGVNATFLSALNCSVIRGGEGVTLIYPLDSACVPVVSTRLGRWGSVVVDQFVRELRKSRSPSQGFFVKAPTTERIEQFLLGGRLSETQIAAKLDLSVATLRRRLTDEGTTFRRIANDVRRQMAEMQLATDRPIDDIAAELGFSDDRSFRRACHHWFGLSPTEYRNRGLTELQNGTGVNEAE